MPNAPLPELVHVADLNAGVAPAVDVSPSRRIIAPTGGEIKGRRVKGVVLPGGADFQFIRPDRVVETCRPLRHPDRFALLDLGQKLRVARRPANAGERPGRRERVDSSLIYFRTRPRFETSAVEYQWLTTHIFIRCAVRLPDSVNISFYQLL